MANYETITYEKVEDKIFRLTLNRPEKLNALSQKLLSGIRKRDERVRERSRGEHADHSRRRARVFGGLRSAGHAASGLEVHRHQRSLWPAQDHRAMAAAVEHQQADHRAGAWLLPRRRHRADWPLRYRVRERGRAVRPSSGTLAGNSADALDVAGADGSAQDQGVLFHRRLHVGERSARMASHQSRLSEGQARGRNARLLRAASRWCPPNC